MSNRKLFVISLLVDGEDTDTIRSKIWSLYPDKKISLVVSELEQSGD